MLRTFTVMCLDPKTRHYWRHFIDNNVTSRKFSNQIEEHINSLFTRKPTEPNGMYRLYHVGRVDYKVVW